MISQEQQILDIYIKEHNNPKDEFQRGFIKALEMLNEDFKKIKA